MQTLRALFAAILLSLLASAAFVCLSAPAAAQQTSSPDYATWEVDAKAVEKALTSNLTTNATYDKLRENIVAWRSKFTQAQSANAAQIETLKGQITALGPAPTEATPDAPEIAKRRKALNDQLAQLQAPGLTAVEAYSRADGLIRQIDAKIRAKQARELLRLSPSPANPANWPAGFAVLNQGMRTLWAESDEAWQDPERRSELKNNLPVIALFLAIAALLVLRGPGFIERLTTRLQRSSSMRARNVAAALVSLGQVIVPVGGVILLVLATKATSMTGTRSGALIAALPAAAFFFFTVRWIGLWLFRGEGAGFRLTDRPAEARFHVNMIALMLALEAVRRAFTTEVRPPLSMAAQSVWAAPFVCIIAVFLFRLGMLLRSRSGSASVGPAEFGASMLQLIGTAVVGVSILAPLLAVIGYVAAANALMWPTVVSLGLLGLIMVTQRFATDLYLLATQRGEEGREALLPVLIGFALTVLALPIFALIWGARTADLSEAWTRFSAGVSIGNTRLSPSVLVTFVAIFVIGFMFTRLLQSALRSAVLPRTKLDKGVQNAVISGVGYLGIFLAALIAITTAGIDLSSLAIVAGALSVGIGFGLQNIVSNFVSGIILLIERPISEGDWIEVNGQHGTVRSISVRSTRIETFDRSDMIIPNADLISGTVTNYTHGNTIGRLILPVGVAYDTDTHKVESILLEIADAQPMSLVNPAPYVVFSGIGAEAFNLELRIYLSDINFMVTVRTAVYHEIVRRFREEKIEMPYSTRDLWIRNPEDLRPVRPRECDGQSAAEPAPPTGDPAGSGAGEGEDR